MMTPLHWKHTHTLKNEEEKKNLNDVGSGGGGG